MNVLVTSFGKTPINNVWRRNSFIIRNLFEQPFCRQYSIISQENCFGNRVQCLTVQQRHYSDEKSSIVPKAARDSTEVSTSISETVKETTKTTFYSLVILGGIGVTALLFYTVFRELFSSKSPNGVYTKAFEKCVLDTRVQDALGEPIKGHGETTRRGRRQHVNRITYMKDNVEHMRMQFYLKGARKSGTVHLEVIEGSSGSYEYRYLFVQMDEWPHKVIVLEDNRHDRTTITSGIQTPLDVEPSSPALNLS